MNFYYWRYRLGELVDRLQFWHRWTRPYPLNQQAPDDYSDPVPDYQLWLRGRLSSRLTLKGPILVEVLITDWSDGRREYLVAEPVCHEGAAEDDLETAIRGFRQRLSNTYQLLTQAEKEERLGVPIQRRLAYLRSIIDESERPWWEEAPEQCKQKGGDSHDATGGSV